ncbi:Gfo/Idh/MocA family protein [Streptomyces albireticuli]|uniref:Gfo/Idh/MocA family protein n=1 Tax=Streptomyces albireticuli TaxID=1940 RepID=UPI0036A54A18
MPVNRVGVALVGPGGASRRHAEALARVDGAELRGVLRQGSVDGLPEGVTRYASWDRLLGDPSVRLVSFCTPGSARTPLARQALEAGKAVLLEGIATRSTAELDRLVAVSERTGHPAGAMLPHRYGLPRDMARWGRRDSATATVAVSRYHPPAPPGCSDRCGTSPDLADVVTRLGVPYLDLACQLLGPPADVQVTGPRERTRNPGGRVAGVVRFAAGSVLSFVLTCESPTRIERLAVLDVEQSLIIEDGRLVTEGAAGPVDHSPMDLPELRSEVYRDMAEAVVTGRPPRGCDLSGTRAVTTVLEAVRRRFEAAAGGSSQRPGTALPENDHGHCADPRPT